MEATASLAGDLGWGDTISKLVQPSCNLRPLLILLALFFFYPICGVYNISFFAVSLFKDLGLGGAETVAVFTALVRCLGTVASTLLLLRSDSSGTGNESSQGLKFHNQGEVPY